MAPIVDRGEATRQQRIYSALGIVRKAIEDLLNDRVPFDKLVITKLLKDSYKLAAKNEKKSAKKARKLDFTHNNVFVDDIVIFKSCSGVVIEKTLDKVTVLVKIDEIERELVFSYMSIKGKGPSVIHLDKILNPETDERELMQVVNPHVRLARRLYARDPVTAPGSGTRVPYVFCESKTAQLQHERAEDPGYAQAHNLRVDPIYYLEHQCANAWGQILDTVCPGAVQQILAEAYDCYKRRGQMQPNLKSLLAKTGKEDLTSVKLSQKPVAPIKVTKKRRRKGDDPKQGKLKF